MMASPYSTLPEIDKRAELTTLEVRASYPRLESVSYTGLELVVGPPDGRSRGRGKRAWRKRSWLLLSGAILLVVVAAVVGGIVAGLLRRSGTADAEDPGRAFRKGARSRQGS